MRAHRASGPCRLAGLALLTAALTVFSSCSDDPTGPPRIGRVEIVSGDNQTAQVATTLADPIVVKVFDSLGAPAARQLVRLSGIGQPQEDSVLTDNSGTASTRWTLSQLSGTHFLQATALVHGEMRSVVFRATALPGDPASIVATQGDSAIAVPGTELDTIAVTVLDGFTNVISNTPVAWSVTSGGGSVRAHAARTDSRGNVRASWTLGSAQGLQTLGITVGGLTKTMVASTRSPFVATDIVVGVSHTCALTADGLAYCWGSNREGQLGSGGSFGIGTRIPVPVAGGLTFSSLVAGAYHTCGLTKVGETYCWGYNSAAQAGSGAGQVLTAPTRVLGAPAFTALAAGLWHTCGLTSGGAVLCWGDNSVGQMGNAADRVTPARLNSLPQRTPIRIASSLVFQSIAAAYFFTCATSTVGETQCWGANWQRALGSDVVQTCVILEWDFYYYEESEVSVPCSTAPLRVTTSGPLTSVSANRYGVCGVSTSSELFCWGDGLTPTVTPGARVVRAWRLSNAVCGQDAAGAVSCWTLSLAPIPVKPFGADLTLVHLRSDGRHTCGLTPAIPAIAYCWGLNTDGELGDATKLTRLLPVPVLMPLPDDARRP